MGSDLFVEIINRGVGMKGKLETFLLIPLVLYTVFNSYQEEVTSNLKVTVFNH